MTQRNSIWRLAGKNVRGSGRRGNSKHSSGRRQRGGSKGFWTVVSDTVLFQPHKSETLPMWRDMYKLNRQLSELDRSLSQPAQAAEAGIGSWVKSQLQNAWNDFVVECKALLTALAFHLLTLVLIVVFNLIWFWLLFFLLSSWLG